MKHCKECGCAIQPELCPTCDNKVVRKAKRGAKQEICSVLRTTLTSATYAVECSAYDRKKMVRRAPVARKAASKVAKERSTLAKPATKSKRKYKPRKNKKA